GAAAPGRAAGLGGIVGGDDRRLRGCDRGGRDDGSHRTGDLRIPSMSNSVSPDRLPRPGGHPAMAPTLWRRAMVYLGLQDDEELEYDADYEYENEGTTAPHTDARDI